MIWKPIAFEEFDSEKNEWQPLTSSIDTSLAWEFSPSEKYLRNAKGEFAYKIESIDRNNCYLYDMGLTDNGRFVFRLKFERRGW